MSTEVTTSPADDDGKDGESAKQYPWLTPWKPGQSGNPRGRPAAGLSIREEINRMVDWTEERVREVARDKTTSVAARTAAKQLLQMMSDDTTKVGQPIAGEAVDRVFDRTVGKAVQAIESKHTEEITVTQVNVDLAACLSHFEQFSTPKIVQVEPAKLPEPSV